MRTARLLLGAAGAVLLAVGGWLFVGSGVDNLLAAVVWLAGGVAVHDGLVAPATVAVGAMGARRLPTWSRAPVSVALVVVGTVTLAAVPVLGRFGAKSDNASLLDRDYGVGWLGFAAAVIVAAGGWAALRHRARIREETDGQSSRRRRRPDGA